MQHVNPAILAPAYAAAMALFSLALLIPSAAFEEAKLTVTLKAVAVNSFLRSAAVFMLTFFIAFHLSALLSPVYTALQVGGLNATAPATVSSAYDGAIAAVSKGYEDMGAVLGGAVSLYAVASMLASGKISLGIVSGRILSGLKIVADIALVVVLVAATDLFFLRPLTLFILYALKALYPALLLLGTVLTTTPVISRYTSRIGSRLLGFVLLSALFVSLVAPFSTLAANSARMAAEVSVPVPGNVPVLSQLAEQVAEQAGNLTAWLASAIITLFLDIVAIAAVWYAWSLSAYIYF